MPDITAPDRSKPSTESSDLLAAADEVASTLTSAAKLITDLAIENVRLRSTQDQLVGDDEQAARDRHPAGKGIAKPLTHDDVRAIVSEEISKAFDLPGLGIFIERLEPEGPMLDLSENNSVVASGHLDVVLDEIVVHLDLGLTPVVLKRKRDGWVEPNCDRFRTSIVVRADARNKESFSFAKAHHRGELNSHEESTVCEVERGVTADDSSHFRPSPSVDDADAHSVGETDSAGGASANPADDVTFTRPATEVHLGSSNAWPIEVHFPALGRFAARISVDEARTLAEQLKDKIRDSYMIGGRS